MNAHTTHLIVGAATLWLLAGPAPAAAQEGPIEPDRPDFTNSAHLVPRHTVQVELGVAYRRDSETETGTDVPVTVRLGVSEWLEAQVGFQALVTAAGADAEAAGDAAFQAGAKIRLARGPDGNARLSLGAALVVPPAFDEQGIKSRHPDVTLAGLWGFDMGSRAHLDVNYGVGSIRDGALESRFVQQFASGSLLLSITSRWIPYFEVFGISRERVDGSPVVAASTGVTFVMRPRIALDAGVLFGATAEAPAFSAFGGIAFVARQGRPRARATSASRLRGRD